METTARSATDYDTVATNKSDRVFDSSAYGYLIYSPKDRSLSEFLIGVLTLVSQYVLLGIIIKQGMEELKKDEVAVMVKWHNCNDFNTYYETFPPVELLQCEANEVNMQAFLFTLVFVSYFVAGDFFACLKVLIFEGNWISKFLSAFVLIENLMTVYAAIIFGFWGAYNQGEQYAAISGCIGVLFVNDIDEKIYEATKVLFKDTDSCCGKCWNQCGPVLCTLGFIAGIIVAGYACSEVLYESGSAEFTLEDANKLDNYGYFYEGGFIAGTDEASLCQKFVCSVDKTCCGDFYSVNPVCASLKDALCQGLSGIDWSATYDISGGASANGNVANDTNNYYYVYSNSTRR